MIRQSLIAYGEPLAGTTAALPEPKGSEVLLRVSACGVCHSDLHLQDGHFDLGDGKRHARRRRGMAFEEIGEARQDDRPDDTVGIGIAE